jgi:nucleoside-diphosphate-sugar epimerase
MTKNPLFASPPGHLFCFGLGYSAMVLIDILLADGWKISGTTRNTEKAQTLRDRGIEVYEFSLGKPVPMLSKIMADVSHILVSIPPDNGTDPVLAHHREDLAFAHLRWVGYLSTTGVYGDHQGDWVDEFAACSPVHERSQNRLDVEKKWQEQISARDLPLHIFRLAGIYGPGRSALDQVRNGRAKRVDKKDHVFNRIHVTDLARILYASMRQPRVGAIYNVADDEPCPSHEVVTYACELLNVDPPGMVPLAWADLTPMARSFYDECKRVMNRKVKQDLAITLLYSNYRDGLSAQFANEWSKEQSKRHQEKRQ